MEYSKEYLEEVGNSIEEIIDFEIHNMCKYLNKTEEKEKNEIETAFRAGMRFSFVFQDLIRNKLNTEEH